MIYFANVLVICDPSIVVSLNFFIMGLITDMKLWEVQILLK